MYKAYRFKLYPTKRQVEALHVTLLCCQRLYNAALEQRKDAWHLHQRGVSYYDQQNQIPGLREEHPEYGVINANLLRDPLRRLDKAFQGFFRRIKQGDTPGFPRFKAYDRYDSFTFSRACEARIKNNRVKLSMIGAVKIKLSRPIEGRIRTATVKREGKHWYISFACDNVPARELPPSDKAIGIDLGLSHFATFSTGEKVANPRHMRKSKARLAKAQQALAKKKRRTAARRKAKAKVNRIYRKVKNQRQDFLHKLSRRIVNEYGHIVVEDLGVKGLLELKGEIKKQDTALHRSISDAGWSFFLWCLEYKAAEAADATRQLVRVNPRGTTRTCNRCGHLNDKLPLSQRTFLCAACGYADDRDVNAAKNILGRGTAFSEGRSR